MVNKSVKKEEPPLKFPDFIARTSEYKDQCTHQIILENQIIVFNNFLTPRNTKVFLEFFKTSITPLLKAPSPPNKGEATRTNERFSIMSPEFAHALFHDTNLNTLLEGIDDTIIGLNPNIRIYKYTKGAFFGPHYDDSVRHNGARSTWTLLIYLTESLIGGETSFQVRGGTALTPSVTPGMALIHRHGNDCLLHEGLPVKSGVKWVLRSDLMSGM